MIFFIFSKFIFQYHFIAFIATCVFKILIPPLGTRIQSEEMFIAGTRISVEEKKSWQMCDEFIAIRFAFLGSEIVKEIENSFVHGETQEFQIVFQDPAQRQELCIGGHHFEVTWVTWIVPVSKWQKLLGWNLLVQVHVFTFEHLEVGRLNSGRENVHRDWRRDEKGGIRDKTSDEYDQGWCRWLILVFGCFDVLYLDVLMFFAVFEWWLCRHRAPLARTIGCQWMNWMNKNLRRNDSIVAIASLGNQKGNYQMYSCVD